MNIKRINLNLLQALNALLKEGSVTRASEKLAITQSAMSNNLTQLRELFDDELLIRSGKQMRLTHRALELKPRLQELMCEVQDLVSVAPSFDPATSQRIFRVAMSDFAHMYLLPHLMGRLEKLAPNIELFTTYQTHVSGLQPFYEGRIELAVGCFVSPNLPLSIEPCLSFGSAVALRRDHPLLKGKFNLKKYLSAKHIRIQYQQEYLNTVIDRALSAIDSKRSVLISIPNILSAFYIVQHSDLVGTFPHMVTPQMAEQFNLVAFPPPFKIPNGHIHTVWDPQNDKDPGLVWLRDQIRCSAREAMAELQGL